MLSNTRDYILFSWFVYDLLWAIDLFDGKYQIIYKHEYKHDKLLNIYLNIILRNSNFKLAYIALLFTKKQFILYILNIY